MMNVEASFVTKVNRAVTRSERITLTISHMNIRRNIKAHNYVFVLKHK